MISPEMKQMNPKTKLIRWVALALVLSLTGCGGSTEKEKTPVSNQTETAQKSTGPTFPGVTLKLATLEDPALAQVAADLVGEWRASRQADVEIVEKPAMDPKTGLDPAVDIWLVRGQKLGELVDKDAIEPLGELNADWASRPPVFDAMVSRYGPERFAVPVGTSLLVMAYRESLFNQPEVKTAIEKAGITFPPATWEELEKTISLLQGKVEIPIVFPTLVEAGDSTALDLFLARATALGKHRDHFSFLMSAETMAPRVSDTPFADALKGLVAIKPKQKMTTEQGRAAFRDGKAAILFDYANNAAKWANADEKSKIGVAPLPGSLKVYEPDRKEYEKMQSTSMSAYLPSGGGWLAVIAKGRDSKKLEAARDFLTYLAGESTAGAWAIDKRIQLLPTRDTLLANGFIDPRTAPRVESGAWGEAILKQLTSPNVVVGLRVPQADKFLNDLNQSVQAAFDGQPAEAALGKAADAWKKRIADFGLQRMKWHYRRSLVKPVTDSVPPAAGQ